MKKLLITTLIALSFSAASQNTDAVKLIVTKSDGTRQTLFVDESDKESVINSIHNGIVEEDVVVQSPKSIASTTSYGDFYSNSYSTKSLMKKMSSSGAQAGSDYTPNDKFFDDQVYWSPVSSEHLGLNNVLESVRFLSPLRRPVVGVVDSGFYQHPDLNYLDGYSMASAGTSNERQEYYFIKEEFNGSPEDRLMNCTVHGTGVAGIAVATRDNDIGIAGIADADFIATRALNCGGGLLSDVSDSILWQIGEQVDDIRPAVATVDVINVSLGGGVDKCPSYMQASIDSAVNKNIPVVVAVGNQQIDASGFTPSNCNDVITVAGATLGGDLFHTSNYGQNIDIVALGDYVASLTEYPNGIGWWDESSFATPIVTGVIANAISELGALTTAELKFFLYATAQPFAAGQCDDSNRCGAGILDAAKFQSGLREYKAGNLVTLKPALNNTQLCDKSLYATDDSELARLCETFELVLPEIQSNRNDVRFEILSFSKGADMSYENGNVVISSQSTRLLLSTLDISTYDYGVRMCNSERCFGDTAIKVTNNTNDKPAVCNKQS